MRLKGPAIGLYSSLILLLAIPTISAGIPSQVTYSSSGLAIPFSNYGDIGDCRSSCLRFGSGIIGGFHDAIRYTNKWANYTNFAFGGVNNPTQSFNVALNRMNVSLNAIASVGIEFQANSITTFTSGMPSITTFTPAIHAQTTLYPVEVDVTAGNLKTVVLQGSFVKTATAFSACSAPCVFGNPSNATVVVKTPTTMPETVDIILLVPPAIIPVNSPDFSGYIALLLLPLILILFLKRRGQPENVRSQ